MKYIFIFIFIFLLNGCTAEGNSFYLGNGAKKLFLNMEDCGKEALSEHSGGGKIYSGFECREMFMFVFQKSKKIYLEEMH